MGSKRKVLIVEDEMMIAEYFKIVVESLGYDVCGIAPTARDAVELAKQEDPEMVFMDVRLKGEGDGIDAAIEIHQHKTIPTVYITGSREDETLERIKLDHPSDVLIKPVLAGQLQDALSRFCPRQ